MAYEIYYTSAQQGSEAALTGMTLHRRRDRRNPSHAAACWNRSAATAIISAPAIPPAVKIHVTSATFLDALSLSGKTSITMLSRAFLMPASTYTHRTNSLAHHIALEASELPPPARRGCWPRPMS